MFYFAYGSNMSIARLRARVPGASRVAMAVLAGHDLRFHKRGRDGSGKCDAFHTAKACDRVVGSVFEIDPLETPALHRAEGLGSGYEQKQVCVLGPAGEQWSAFTYYATAIDATLCPYSWYLHHVLVGATESGCPADYVDRIAAVDCIDDEDLARDAAERALHS
ncbi:MAG: gamma-glutamylcyclotransferase family protein [Halioglobus sp.]|nr:gamma-glutamylcyclotransferase family protein [Halioglobus sp.]